MDQKPILIREVGAPAPTESPIGRLNDERQSVLYLADSPDTAFAERGSVPGYFCLSEWRVTAAKLAMANGGIPSNISERFRKEGSKIGPPEFIPRTDAEAILNLFREIFTLNVQENLSLYRWSIACGLASGFSHKCDRAGAVETAEGITRWEGRWPFGTIAYPSVRASQTPLNFALNDHGKSHVKLHHVQWVQRFDNGFYTSLDFANEWDDHNVIHWQNRPAKFQLKRGEAAMVTKVAETMWRYETTDGSIPWFA